MDILNFALTIILFLTSLFLILLVLVQLPKKEAGLGTAFGGGTTDALFGAGAGNVLTQLTKYCTILFLVLCLVLSIMNKRDSEKTTTADTDKNKANKKQPAQPGNGLSGAPSVPTSPIGPELPVNPTPEPSDTTPEPSGITPEPSGTTTPEPSGTTPEPSGTTPEPTPTQGEPNKK